MIRTISWVLCTAILAAIVAPPAVLAGKASPSKKAVKKTINRAYAYLKTAQNANGSFAPKRAGAGITALVVAALLKNGYSADDPVVAKALSYLKSQVQENGSVSNSFLANYITSVAMMAFKEANEKGKYNAVLKKAATFLKSVQHLGPQSETKDAKFGGFGYNKKTRPDMSNTIFSVEALLAAGVPKDDPAIKNALKFISRCQNLAGEHNDRAFAKKASKDDRGGLTYTPYPEKNPNATKNGGLRSLGAMTYGGLKSFLYAGLKRNDPRVKAAINWIRRHYTLKENPGMGKAGLYYYFHTFAKAMDALGEDVFVDANKKKHNWRMELFDTIRAQQRADGSWINKGDRRFGENTPELATAFAVLSISYCYDGKK